MKTSKLYGGGGGGGGGLEMTIDLISALHLKQNIEYSVKYFMLFYCEHSVLFILSVQLKL